MGPIPDVLHAKSIGSGVGRMSQTPVAVLPICEKETQAEITTKATSCNESARVFFGETPESSELRPWTAPSQLWHCQHLPNHVKSATDDEDVANFAMKIYGAHNPYASNAAERFEYWISRRSLALAALAARSPAHRESRARTRLALAFALRSDLWPLHATKINREELAKLFLAAEAESVAELAPKLDAYTLFEKLKVNCHWQLDTRGADAINAAALDELFPEPDLHGLLDADRLRAQLLRARAFFDAAKTRFLGKDTMRILEYLVALGEGPSPLPSLRKQRAAVRTAEAEVEVAIKAARREGSNAHLEALRARVSERDEAREALLSALLKAGGDRTAQEADWLRASISRARAAFFCSDDKNLPRPDRGAATRALDWATKLPRRVVRAQKKTDKAWEAAQSPGAKRGALGLPSEQLLEAAVGAMSEERQEYEKSAFGGMSSKLLREAISAAVECVGDADSAPEARREELERLECALEPISLEPLWKLLGDVDDVRVIQQRIELEILELNVKKRRRGAEVDEGEEEKRLAKIDELERRRAELPSVVALDRKICHERAALLLRAERYRPELLCDPKWRDDLNIASEDLVGVGRMDLLLAHAKLSDFERVGSLGSGAKEVHKVRHFEAGKMSVIKVFHLGAAGAQRRFFRQVSELARLRSAHVIRVEGVFLADAMHGCVLFPFCEGGDLGAWISANAGAGQDERKRIAREVLMGLCDLHVERLVHCDIKPSNIFLAADGTVVLGDFDGVQRADVSLTQPMQATADFMAPELRADPTRVGPPADIYSTGMVLRQLFREEREPAMEELIAAMCAEDPLARPTASEARKHAAFRSAPVSASTCLICCDESTSGLSCGDPAHFVCRGCLGDAVQSAVAGDAASSVKITRGGEMACFTPTCGGCLPARELASTLRPDDFAAWMRAVRSAVEREVRVSAQLRPAGSVHEHVNHISSKLLVNSCPACGAAFHDFEGCLALQCSNCSTYVCGWCFQGFPASRTGKSACHTHVARCPSVSDQWRRIYWAEDMDLVHKQWGILRAKRVREYLESLPEPTRAEVFDAVQPLLTDDVMRGAEVFGDEKEDAGEEDAEEYDDVIEIE